MSSTVLTWNKPLTIEIVRDLALELKSALSQCDELVIDLGQCPEIDLAVMQLLCAAERSASLDGKRLSLRLSPESAVIEVAAAGGFIRQSPCVHSCGACIWLDSTLRLDISA